ncbi:MAG TPA: hypothetical protein VKE92_06300, partial [Anaerolineales bacterium]|nr:hypothetical protein [Anaerolineales bacterium]
MENRPPVNKNIDPPGFLSRLMQTLVGLGLGESLLRIGTTVLSVILLGVVIWLVRLFYAQAPAGSVVNALETEPTVDVAEIDNVSSASVDSFGGIPRLAQVHTIIPSRPRQEIVKYTVLEGDT